MENTKTRCIASERLCDTDGSRQRAGQKRRYPGGARRGRGNGRIGETENAGPHRAHARRDGRADRIGRKYRPCAQKPFARGRRRRPGRYFQRGVLYGVGRPARRDIGQKRRYQSHAHGHLHRIRPHGGVLCARRGAHGLRRTRRGCPRKKISAPPAPPR